VVGSVRNYVCTGANNAVHFILQAKKRESNMIRFKDDSIPTFMIDLEWNDTELFQELEKFNQLQTNIIKEETNEWCIDLGEYYG